MKRRKISVKNAMNNHYKNYFNAGQFVTLLGVFSGVNSICQTLLFSKTIPMFSP